MPFGIPNEGDATWADQAEPDSVDFDVLVAGFGQTGVVSGCAVTPGTGLSVSVGSGVAVIGGAVVEVSAQADQTVATADATNPRFDLVTVNTSGTVVLVTGAPAVSPIFPSVPASRVVLASVFVPANDTGMDASQIVDKRVVVSAARVRKKAASVTLDGSYAAVVVDSAAAARSMTLPLTTAVPGHAFLFKRAGSNPVYVYRAGSDVFDDGATSKTLGADGSALSIMSVGDGTWYIAGARGTVT